MINFSSLTIKASLGELTSLEELLAEMTKKQLIESSVIQVLWEIFGTFDLSTKLILSVAMRYGKTSKKTPLQSRGALIILSMIGSADPEVIRNKINLLVQVGLGPRWKEDEYLARYTCVALQKLAKKETAQEDKGIIAFSSFDFFILLQVNPQCDLTCKKMKESNKEKNILKQL